jgi:hypothetical protein
MAKPVYEIAVAFFVEGDTAEAAKTLLTAYLKNCAGVGDIEEPWLLSLTDEERADLPIITEHILPPRHGDDNG